MKRDLGRMGQDILSLWAHEAGIIINPSIEDTTGWDYLLEFKSNLEPPDIPSDLKPPEISCFFQVKTTCKNNLSRISIKLSNWERLVKNPYPTFFLLLFFGPKNNILNQAYLIHIGEEWITKTLQRQRELLKSDPLNKHTLDLTWKSSEKLISLNGKELHDLIQSYVGNRFDKYVEDKISTINNIGGNIKALWKLSSEYNSRDDFYKEWVDFAIGLKNSISVDNLIREADIRFGIPAVKEEYKGGILEYVNKFDGGKDIDIVIKNNTIDLYSSFHAKLFTPFLFFPGDSLPKEYMKYRITFNIGEIIVRPHIPDKPIILSIDFSEAFSINILKEHINTWRLAEILFHSKEYGCIVELISPNYHPIKLDLTYEIGEVIDTNIFKTAITMENLWYVSRYFDINPDSVISFSDIISQEKNISILRKLCEHNYKFSRWTISTKKILPLIINKCAIIFNLKIKFENDIVTTNICVAGSIIQKEFIENKNIILENPEIIHMSKSLYNQNLKQISNNRIMNNVNDLEKQGYFVIPMDEITDANFNSMDN